MRDHDAEDAIKLATQWLNRANQLITSEEINRHQQLARLMANPSDVVTLTQLIDQSFRSQNYSRVADQIAYILTSRGIPGFFLFSEKILLNLFLLIGRHLPMISIPQIIKDMRNSSNHLIIPGEKEPLTSYLYQCKREGIRVNVNHIGEEVLGEEEARRQLEAYLADLRQPDIEYVSIKISTIFSQLHPLAFEYSVGTLSERLAELYREAANHNYISIDGSRAPKFVNLDMEAYRDLEMTSEAFKRTLSLPEFKQLYAGMALQAYLPDSYNMLKDITRWAQQRVADGGSQIKIRIVKGANLEIERLESNLYDWPTAPYDDKSETDANYKRMVRFGLQPENSAAVHIGVASHNLFDLAYAYLVAQKKKTSDNFSFEMITGMANHFRRALAETGQEIITYAPVAKKDQFINAIAYLVRRLDENTGPRNFLREAHGLRADSKAWKRLASQFRSSLRKIDTLPNTPYRQQNRQTEKWPARMGTCYGEEFRNIANTDWSLKANREWAVLIRSKWDNKNTEPVQIPLVIGGEEIFNQRRRKECLDPNHLPEKRITARFTLANMNDVDRAVATARKDPDGWRKKTITARHRILSRVAHELRKARGDLIGAAAADTGKLFTESDVEVSEAIDFAEFYPSTVRQLDRIPYIRHSGRGVGVVISPWNFPIAIPCGGIVASLAAGNTVIFKPSSEAVFAAWTLSQCFWKAGVSMNTLQFLPCPGSSSGAKLTGHSGVDYVILTGGTSTGLSILSKRPDLYLAAETGGKNATIVTAMADRDQAIANVIYSAFGNSGQKCSATSLLILEDEVYNDLLFKKHLVDAARSLPVGSAWEFASRMGPLIHPPGKDLKRAMMSLESGETWALKPKQIDGNPQLWTPGIKWDVQPGSTTHMVEFFGPLLGVMRARNLDQAIELVNQTGYGLTSGLETLDQREQERWQEKVMAGNLYINRGTTGAVTLRQPFGGMGKSALGAGFKAGGPDYTAQFMQFEEKQMPAIGPLCNASAFLDLTRSWQLKLDQNKFEDLGSEIQKTIAAIKSYLYHNEKYFSQRNDFFHLPGQDNQLRYMPLGKIVVRLHSDDNLFETLARVAAVKITGNHLWVSIPRGLHNEVTRFLVGKAGQQLLGNSPVYHEDDTRLIEEIPKIQRIRYAMPSRVPQEVFAAASKNGFYVAREPVRMEGRLELLQYLRQQSICNEYHRYGNIGDRSGY